MTYGKDLPGNLGTEGILRAIYDKIGAITPSESKIDGKLDDIIERIDETKDSINKGNESISGVIDEKLDDVIEHINETKDSIETISGAIDENTQAIKKVANNVKGISDVNAKGFESIVNALKEESEDKKPHPKPFPPCPHHHHHCIPCPPVPPPFYDCAHHYLPNTKDVHNMCIESNPNLSREQKNYLNDVYNGYRKFNPKEYYLLPRIVPPMFMPIVKHTYLNMLYPSL